FLVRLFARLWWRPLRRRARRRLHALLLRWRPRQRLHTLLRRRGPRRRRRPPRLLARRRGRGRAPGGLPLGLPRAAGAPRRGRSGGHKVRLLGRGSTGGAAGPGALAMFLALGWLLPCGRLRWLHLPLLRRRGSGRWRWRRRLRRSRPYDIRLLRWTAGRTAI